MMKRRFAASRTATHLPNTNSPLQLERAQDGRHHRVCADGQLMIVTRSHSPARWRDHDRGALTLAHAEALFGIALSQIVRPGAPVMYGSFTSNVDMKSGSPAFGTPEYAKAAFGAGSWHDASVRRGAARAPRINTPSAAVYEVQE